MISEEVFNFFSHENEKCDIYPKLFQFRTYN